MTGDASTIPFAVAVAVGPGPRELERLADLAESIVAYAPASRGWLVMVDDAEQPRGLDRLAALPPSITPISLHHPRHGSKATFVSGKGICAAVLQALAWTQANTDARVVLKVDTDSLVIGPFVGRLEERFSEDPALAIVGAYTLTPNGTPREFTTHDQRLRKLAYPAFDWRHPRGWLRRRRRVEARLLRSLVTQARPHGYVFAEHCMGGGYAVGRAFLDAAAAAGQFVDPSRWINADLPEDVMMGLHARALGMTLANSVAPGEIFGVRYLGLPDPPERLAANGYAVIHAVKNDPTFAENAIRDFFRQRRQGH